MRWLRKTRLRRLQDELYYLEAEYDSLPNSSAYSLLLRNRVNEIKVEINILLRKLNSKATGQQVNKSSILTMQLPLSWTKEQANQFVEMFSQVTFSTNIKITNSEKVDGSI